MVLSPPVKNQYSRRNDSEDSLDLERRHANDRRSNKIRGGHDVRLGGRSRRSPSPDSIDFEKDFGSARLRDLKSQDDMQSKDATDVMKDLARTLVHPVINVLDSPLDQRLEQLYLLFHMESIQIRFFDEFCPYYKRKVDSDYRGVMETYDVFNGQYIIRDPKTKMEKDVLRAFLQAEKDMMNSSSWLSTFKSLFEARFHKDRSSHIAFTMVDQTFVLTTVVVTLMQTYEKYADNVILEMLEAAASVYFTIIYIVDAIIVRNTWTFLTRPMCICDFLAIIPWYLEKMLGDLIDLNVLSILKIFRLLRLTKLDMLNSPYGEMVVDSITLWAQKTGAMIAMYVVMVMIGAGVFLTASDEVPNATVGLFLAFTMLGNSESPLDAAFEEMPFMIVITIIVMVICSITLIASIINALTQYFVFLSLDFDKRKMAIAETMYDHFSGDYEFSHMKDVNVKYHTMNDDINDIYKEVREALISRLCRPHVYAAPWKEEELSGDSAWLNEEDVFGNP